MAGGLQLLVLQDNKEEKSREEELSRPRPLPILSLKLLFPFLIFCSFCPFLFALLPFCPFVLLSFCSFSSFSSFFPFWSSALFDLLTF